MYYDIMKFIYIYIQCVYVYIYIYTHFVVLSCRYHFTTVVH